MSAERVRLYLMEHGIGYRTHDHPEAFTTPATAEAAHVPGREMAKVVMLMADDSLVMAVLPGHHMVDIGKARDALGADEVRLATEAEFLEVFGDCELGAEPPFGALYDVPTVVDLRLDSPTITFNAGTHTETMTMDLEDYLDVTRPRRLDLAVG